MTAAVYERIRKSYDSPLSLAEDYMVWNVTKDDIKVRMAEVDHHTWAPPLASPAKPPSLDDRKAFAQANSLDQEKLGFGAVTKSGFWDVDDVLRPIFEEASQALGREFPYPDNTEKK
jgi:ribonuclease Z